MKCLPQLLVAVSVLSILDLCLCKPDFGIDKVLGQSQSDVKSDTAIEDEASLPSEDKRDWSKFDTWGKRGWNKNFAVWGRKRWGNFATWGKRSGDATNMDSETGLPDADKRSWYKFNSWGKRDGDSKWQKFSVWGKRDFDEELSPEEKRQWSQFATWGKRLSPLITAEGEPMSEDKRQWSQFATWGKRGGATGTEEDLMDKRKWSSFNSWGKRRWDGLATWGKRAGLNENAVDAVTTRLLRMFDENNDGTLDKSELRNFIFTLMSLPSKPEVVESQ